jgi:putative hydrolase of the HAD superfamily
MKRALLLDLDETLVVEEPSAVAAFEATAAEAARHHEELDAGALALAARACARELWYAAPAHPYCARIGISSWEGLWCRFEGDDPDTRWLREWAPTYRREAWRLTLAEQGVEDDALAETLGERFVAERRARHVVYEDVVPALEELRATHALALVTNGASCLQREKLAGAGLGRYFDAVVVSGDLGAGKPDPAIFRHALAQLEADERDAVMVGDNLVKDVDGAIAAGLGAVWMNRDGAPRPADRPELAEISMLSELSAALGALSSAAARPSRAVPRG